LLSAADKFDQSMVIIEPDYERGSVAEILYRYVLAIQQLLVCRDPEDLKMLS
jgi:hypothetical protein